MIYSRLTYKCWHFLAIDTILYKYPSDGFPENYFEETDKERIESYKICSINGTGKIIGLIITKITGWLLPPQGTFAGYL